MESYRGTFNMEEIDRLARDLKENFTKYFVVKLK